MCDFLLALKHTKKIHNDAIRNLFKFDVVVGSAFVRVLEIKLVITNFLLAQEQWCIDKVSSLV